MITRIQFDVIKHSTKVTGRCTKCGKRRTRTVIKEQTVNPFNRNADGTIKTREEIHEAVWAEVAAEADALQKDFICATCRDELLWPRDEPAPAE
jgi:hypothetical protein